LWKVVWLLQQIALVLVRFSICKHNFFQCNHNFHLQKYTSVQDLYLTNLFYKKLTFMQALNDNHAPINSEKYALV
jgi:hypothetical protein